MSVNEPEKLLAEAVSRFGAEAKKKLSNPAIAGAPEDQLRAPLERLLRDLEPALGLAAHDADYVGEASLSDLKTRPDYAVTRKKALIGFIEVKAPGKGIIPKKFSDPHDKKQWEKLKALPNLIYTDGNGFSLWRNGEQEGEAVHFKGDVRTAGAELSSPPELLSLLTSFFQWQPIIPRSPGQLAEVSARLCRFLRDEVSEQMLLGAQGLTNLASDWRHVPFPNATDEEFADGYAQAVTFGLLMAKARGISLANGPEAAAKLLKKSNSLIGTALDVLTDESSDPETLKTSLKTMTRVFDKIEWAKISKGDPEAWLYFYERFLAKYDSKLRKKTGSYYTPPEIVNEMVRLTDDALRTRFGQHNGLASPDVTVADPAVGTGTFLLGILKRIAASAEKDSGPGMVPSAIQEALKRLIAFEIQFGPYAVAQLRMLAEIAELTAKGPEEEIDAKLRLYVADTLADPDEETQWIPASLQPIAESRKQANAIKRKEPITVVIGNPPYKDRARDLGGWVEKRGRNLPAPMDDWLPPPEWGVGEHARHLYNLYVYFWRWAAWKVFGGDAFRSGTDKSDAKWTNRRGIVCFITAAGFLHGSGFQKMRHDLRRDADEIWVIDCSPEGHQPPVSTRVFQGVQQPVCIVMALRKAEAKNGSARVLFRQLPRGNRDAKFKAIADIQLDDGGWLEASTEARAPFLPESAESWRSYPAIQSLFEYDGSGVMLGRTWVISPDTGSLADRWNVLQNEKDADRRAILFHPHLRKKKGKVVPGDKHLGKEIEEGLANQTHRKVAVRDDKEGVVDPIHYGFRSFDRQWIVPDGRLLNQPNPNLWSGLSQTQVHLTAPLDRRPSKGPAITFTGFIPDLHHYNNRGGRVLPLWTNAAATQSNVRQALLHELSILYGREVSAEDVFAYIAAVAAHPGYTSRFAKDLAQPGLRIPITADAKLFEEAAALGREIVWLHTFGERFADPANNRPMSPPRIVDGPTIPADGAIPMSADKFPDEMRYDVSKQRLYVGEGFIDRVPPAVWAYEVSGMQVLKQWFSYRKKDRSRPIIGDRRPPSPLGDIQPDHWLPEYTSELINVLNVLARLVALEPEQADLLKRIVEGPTHSVEKLGDALRKQP